MITSILVSIIIAILTEETLGWMPHLAKWLVRQNAKHLPSHLTERCEEEWLAHLEQIPGRVSKLLFAIDTYRASYKISHEYLLPSKSYWVTFFIRLFDLSFAFFVLILSLPTFILILLLLKTENPKSPLFTRQTRVGQNNKEFELLKFRVDSSWVGFYLRKYSLNELPQILNILKGDLSLIGPMPKTPQKFKQIEKIIPNYSNRHFVKPGLISWPASKPCGITKENVTKQHLLDLYYIKNLSPLRNLFIFWRVVKGVLMGKQ